MKAHALLLLLLLLLAAASHRLPAAQTPAAKPNLVVFIADDHSLADSQAYGSDEVPTPHMARLARDGMRFTHTFVASPSCGPSRTSLLTGLWPARNGAEPNHMPKREGVPSLPPVLGALGYEVAAIGKVAHGNHAKSHGFDRVEAPGQGLSETAAVAKFLAGRDASKPLCLFVGTRHPHVPWSTEPTCDPASVRIPRAHVDTPATRQARAAYLTDVARADTLLGEVRALVQKHLPGDTVFIYTADHGAQWPFSKWNLYDSGMRVPLLISWPGRLTPGSVCDALVCWPDLLPTFLELAGGQPPPGLDGKSFAPLLLGTSREHRRQVFATHSGDGDMNVYPIRAIRTREWKYIRNLHPEFQHHSHISRSSGSSGLAYWSTWLDAARTDPQAAAVVKRSLQRPAEELYDLEADPEELRNLAEDPRQAGRIAAMRAELDAWMKSQEDRQTVFGKPLLLGETPTLLDPSGAKGRRPQPK